MILQGCSYLPVGWAFELVNTVSSIWPLDPPIFLCLSASNLPSGLAEMNVIFSDFSG